ncbi:hypothetical protein AVEN_218815-1, partial [Araneus ventricosus]
MLAATIFTNWRGEWRDVRCVHLDVRWFAVFCAGRERWAIGWKYFSRSVFEFEDTLGKFDGQFICEAYKS